MSHLRLVRLAGALLAVVVVAALATAGIALAQGGHHHAKRGRSYHAAKASGTGTACPAPPSKAAGGPRLVAAPGAVAIMKALEAAAKLAVAPSGPGAIAEREALESVIAAGIPCTVSAEEREALRNRIEGAPSTVSAAEKEARAGAARR
jgi:hypothetical protein